MKNNAYAILMTQNIIFTYQKLFGQHRVTNEYSITIIINFFLAFNMQ